ncbi:MAG: pyruvate:ferredoxin (flavodoxin) oxidoreductase [Brevinema sp.]
MAVKTMTMDGNKAASYVAYAYTEIAAIYPITPSTPMADQVDTWSAQGNRNIFGDTVRVIEMESEAGAAGTMHGALQAGALTATFTASQGLLLMIPNMYKMAGELLPGVFHVAARTIATHALSIYGDHSDVMACRQTGFAMLASSNVQETHDFAIVAHLAAIKSRVPFLHFFDGFRTSHEMQKIECLDYETLKSFVDMKDVEDFRSRALSPNHPVTRGSAQTPDVFFQNREASNMYYQNLPAIVETMMEKVSKATGRKLSMMEYHGAADAEKVIVVMGSMSDVVVSTVDQLTKQGEKVGVIIVHLYRPFPAKAFHDALPKTVKKIAVLDRTKESGALGEPLYLDVCAAFNEVANTPVVVGGRYGLSSKNTSPAQVLAVFKNLDQKEPKHGFTVGIVDDVTFLSLPLEKEIDIVPADIRECKFYGIGADGTVGANKSSIAIIGDNTDLNVQAHFDYDSKKSGGYTISHLRFGKSRIRLPYLIENPHFVSCSLNSYVYKFDMLKGLRKGGSFLLNTPWSPEEVDAKLPEYMKRYIADNEINFYIINATGIAREMGLGSRSNTILQAAFFKLAEIIPYNEAVQYMKDSAKKTYGRKGDDVVKLNHDAIDKGADELVKIQPKPEWKKCDPEFKPLFTGGSVPQFVANIANPISVLKGDDLPVSAFNEYVDGTMMSGSTKFEKRYVADIVPEWNADNCIQCNQCAFVCPHSVIRPYLIDAAEEKAMPAMATLAASRQETLKYRIAVSVADCTGCTACVEVCPGKGGNKALVMKATETQHAEQDNYNWLNENVKQKNPYGVSNAVGVQFEKPYFEFHAACPGCGETPYIKLVTQLYGNRMLIANTTGCSSIYGGSYPSTPYTADSQGFGPAWANSLFEDNAEFGLGIHAARQQLRNRAIGLIEKA